jgi:pyrroloquinoline quinone (PQQ) biosynthesis protein C
MYEPVPMPTRFLVEMFCDRVAASKIYRGNAYTNADALQYFTKGNAAKKMHPETAKTLERWLRLLAEQGEKAAFAEIRHDLKESKNQKINHVVDKTVKE